MKLKVLCFLFVASMAFAQTKEVNVERFYLTGDSGVQKTGKWAISNFLYKGLWVRGDDTVTTSSDSLGFRIVFHGFASTTKKTWGSGTYKDSLVLSGRYTSLFLDTEWDTVDNAIQTILDTAIVCKDSITSALFDGNADIVNINFITGTDSVQAWIYPTDNTRTGSANVLYIWMEQVSGKNLISN